MPSKPPDCRSSQKYRFGRKAALCMESGGLHWSSKSLLARRRIKSGWRASPLTRPNDAGGSRTRRRPATTVRSVLRAALATAPRYVQGPVSVTGSDPYGLDADGTASAVRRGQRPSLDRGAMTTAAQ
jgi:hypothetical protein